MRDSDEGLIASAIYNFQLLVWHIISSNDRGKDVIIVSNLYLDLFKVSSFVYKTFPSWKKIVNIRKNPYFDDITVIE